MYNYSLTVYLALPFVLLFYKCSVMKKGVYNEEYLSLHQTKMLQTFACIGVILHHVTQLITNYGSVNRGPVTVLSSMGILFTSIFFFCSGYGLYTSVTEKENYLEHFLSHRLFTVLIPFYTANVLYVIVHSVTTHQVPCFRLTFRYIFGLSLINSNGWFIVEIAIIYIAFYIIFKLVKNKDVALILLSACVAGIILYAKSRGHDTDRLLPNSSWFRGEWWFNSTITFIMGLYIARWKDKIFTFIKKAYPFLLAITAVLFTAVFIVEEKVLSTRGYYGESSSIDGISDSTVTLLWQMLLCVIFIMLLMLVSCKFSFSNAPLNAISVICTELFLVHNIFVHNISAYMPKEAHIRYVTALVPSILVAYILNKLNVRIISLLKKAVLAIDFSFDDIPIKINVRKLLRIVIIIAIILLVAATAFFLSRLRLFSGKESKQELDSLRNSKVGDVVYFGRYDTDSTWGKERLEWIVLDVDGGMYKLICKQGIAGSVFHSKHESVSWENSSLRQKLLEPEFMSIFSKEELSVMEKDNLGDYITILSYDEAAVFFSSDEERILTSSEVAKEKGVNVNVMSKTNHWDFKDNKSSWWWLKNEPDTAGLTAPIVSCDGELLADEKYVNKPQGAIRPVITIKLSDVTKHTAP